MRTILKMNKKTIELLQRKIRADGYIMGSHLIVMRALQNIRSHIFVWLANAPGINLGPGSQISGLRFINFGKDISIYRNLWLQAVTEYRSQQFSPVISIGDRVSFSNAVHITAINNITIGNDVLFGSNVYVSDHNHGSYSASQQTPPDIPPAVRDLKFSGAVIIEDNVWFGDNVNVVGPVHIGFGSVIAANSVVRHDVPPCCIVAGIPPSVIKKFNTFTSRWESHVKTTS